MPAEQSQLAVLQAVGACDHEGAPAAEVAGYWSVAPSKPAKEGLVPGGAGPGVCEAQLHGSEVLYPRSVQSRDHGTG